VSVNRTQALVLGFFALIWTSLVAIFAAAPEVYYQVPKLSSAGAGFHRPTWRGVVFKAAPHGSGPRLGKLPQTLLPSTRLERAGSAATDRFAWASSGGLRCAAGRPSVPGS
jgi:hypothetical protein